jgi:beta-mannanase
MTFQIPMLPTDGTSTLAKGAAGNYDTNFTTIGTALVSAGFADAYLRVGWEFNGSWYPWAAKQDPTNWVAYYQHIVKVFRAVPNSKFKFDWNTSLGTNQLAPDQVYPGDSNVDFIGMDAYDQFWGAANSIVTSNTTRWNDLLTTSYGLNWLVTFGQQHNKAISIPEWGVSYRTDGHGGGDDPTYVTNMAAWFIANKVAYQNYYDFNNSTVQNAILNVQGSSYKNNQFPQSAAAYQANAY